MKTIALILTLFIAGCLPAQSINKFRTTALDTAAQNVNQGWTTVTNINIAYPATTIVYVKFYDAYAKVYSKLAHPCFTIQLGTDATLSYKLQSYTNLSFTNGLWVKCTTGITDTSTAEPATKPIVEISY